MIYAEFKEAANQELAKPLETDGEALELFLAYKEYYFDKNRVWETFEEYLADIFGNWETDTHGNELTIQDNDRFDNQW